MFKSFYSKISSIINKHIPVKQLSRREIKLKVSVKENEVPTEKSSSRASIFATKASYISN